jgi:hypothetical protein
MRAFVVARDEGSKVVGAVSSEMAIPYLAKTLRGRTKVLRYPGWRLGVALVTAAAAHALGRGWQDGGIVAKGRGQVR